MKKIFLLIFTSFCFMSFSLITNATCDDAELNEWAEGAYVEFVQDYEETTVDDKGNTIVKEREWAYLLQVHPGIEGVKAVVTNNLDDTKKTYKATEDNKLIMSIGSYIHFDTKKYTINLYGDKGSACEGELLRTITYSVPSYNMYQLTNFCDENPLEDICRMETDTSDVTPEEFDEIVYEYEENEKLSQMNFFEKCLYYIAKYWYYVIIPILLVSIFYIVKIISYKKKVNKE